MFYFETEGEQSNKGQNCNQENSGSVWKNLFKYVEHSYNVRQ